MYSPPLVISIHGIRTVGRWQKTLADNLSARGIPHKTHDFGRYSAVRFVWSGSRQRKIDQFYDWYSNVVQQRGNGVDLSDYRCRPSIIAHSFGSYIVGYAMQKYPDVQFDKVILCGCILPADFDWSTLFHRDQVNFVRNEHGDKDFWTSIVGRFIRDAGASGSMGFQSLSTVIAQERFEYFHHSDYFHERHIESHWLPALRKEPSPLQIRHGRNMDDDIDKFVSTLNTTAAIDDACFSHQPEYMSSQIPRGLSTTWIEVNADIYTFLFDRRSGKAKGYINAMPVRDDCFDKIKSGKIKDNEIGGAEILPFLHNQTVKLYLMSVAIDPALRRASQGLFQEPFERLVNAFFSKLLYYAVTRRIRVSELVAVGWTEQGRKLCEAFDMVCVGKDGDGHSVYWLDFMNENFNTARAVVPGIRKLQDVYRRMAATQN